MEIKNIAKRLGLILCSVISLLLLGDCSNDLDINAPAKDIIAVYGILNPNSEWQYIRVSKAFLTESDAVQYAKENDPSIENASVVLSYRDRQNIVRTITFKPVDTLRNNGTFKKSMKLYVSNEKLTPGITYYLTVTTAGEKPIIAKAHTTIPDLPFILRPSAETINNPDNRDDVLGNVEAYPKADFDQASYTINFSRSRITNSPRSGRSYELRVYLDYFLNGNPQTLRFGPTTPIEQSNTSCDVGNICYRIGKQYQDFLLATLSQQQGTKTYNDSLMSKSCRIEVTALDTFIHNYQRVNNVSYQDFTTVKPEYTNIEGGVGLFGSVHSDLRYVRLSACTKYLAGLNNAPKPPKPCSP